MPEDIQPMLQPLLVSRGLPVNKDLVKLWCIGFDGLSVAEVNAAIAGFVQQSTEFPTPAAVRKFAGPRGLSDESRAVTAWGQVLEQIRKVGGYASVDFEDRITNAVIREMGGWVALCDTESAEMVWRQKEFERLYAIVAKTAVGDASPLRGIIDRTNAKLGYDAKAPVEVPARLPQHATAGRIERQEPAPRIEAPKAVYVGNLLAEQLSADRAPETPALPRVELTQEERAAWVEDQKRKLQQWEQAGETFKAMCREIA